MPCSNNSVPIYTSTQNALLTLFGTTQTQPKLTLTGQEFYQAANTSTDGIALILGVNRSQNRQLWIGDKAQLTPNATITILRFSVGGTGSTSSFDAIATDGATRQSLSIGGDAIITNTSSCAALRKLL